MKRENKIAIISFILSILLMVIIGILTISLIHDNLDVELISRTYVISVQNFTAEKSELIAYALITASFPLAFIAIYKILDKTKFDIDFNTLKLIIGSFILTLIVIITKMTILDAYCIERTLIYDHLIVFLITLLFSALAIILFQKLNNGKAKKILKIIIYILAIAVISAVSFMYINNSYAQTELDAHHFGAYFYPVYKVNSGLTPGVDFNSIYGYYSYFYSFILNIFGGISILKFSYIITFLVLTSFICFAIFANKIIRNKVLWLIVVMALMFTMAFDAYLMIGYNSLQRVPHRILFPALILIYILICNKFRNKHEVLRKIGGAILCALRNVMELRNRSGCTWCVDNVSRV